jgi:hypothetical protein
MAESQGLHVRTDVVANRNTVLILPAEFQPQLALFGPTAPRHRLALTKKRVAKSMELVGRHVPVGQGPQ